MAGGQVLDIEAEGVNVDEQALEDIHRRKTGELIRASIMMPSELASASAEDLERLDSFGRDIGIVFQIRDDLLEVKQDTVTLGKSAGLRSAESEIDVSVPAWSRRRRTARGRAIRSRDGESG